MPTIEQGKAIADILGVETVSADCVICGRKNVLCVKGKNGDEDLGSNDVLSGGCFDHRESPKKEIFTEYILTERAFFCHNCFLEHSGSEEKILVSVAMVLSGRLKEAGDTGLKKQLVRLKRYVNEQGLRDRIQEERVVLAKQKSSWIRSRLSLLD